jgi:hypothetical protein
MESKRNIELALLLHPIATLNSPFELLAEGITIANLENSTVQTLYFKLCEEENCDDGEPLSYRVYLHITATPDHQYFLDFGDPYSIIDRLENTLAIVLSSPMRFSRVIYSDNGFDTALGTVALHSGGPQTDFLESNKLFKINSKTIQDIRQIWENSESIWRKQKARGRLLNAMTYFYYAWNSLYLDQTCINLAITLENLFAPHSASESTHQICFNISRFCKKSFEERKQIYIEFKRFYALRSTIVHGGIPDEDKLVDFVVNTFPIVASILKSILLDNDSINIFSDETKRKHLFEKYLFE